MFHAVCRTRQFYSASRTIFIFGISWTTLSQTTSHTFLFHISLIIELQFGLCLCLLIHPFILLFPEESFYELNVAFIRGTRPNLAFPYLHFIWWKIQIVTLLSVQHSLSSFRFSEYAKIAAQPIFLQYYQSEFLSIVLESAMYSSIWNVTLEFWCLFNRASLI